MTVAIKVKNLKDATDAKTEIEDRQREEKKTGTEEWSPKYFKEAVKGSGTWLPKFTCVFSLFTTGRSVNC